MQHGFAVSASGVPPIDRVLGGVPGGRLVLLGGPSGAGKSAACLQFLKAALDRSEVAVLLTQHRIADVRTHAARVGFDLRSAVRERRLVLLRYRPAFAEQLVLGTAPATVIEALRRAIDTAHPTRIAIDSVAPFLAGGSRAEPRLEALAEYLEGTGATSLLTCAADLPSIDRALDPLVQRSAAILRMSREDRGRLRLERVNARFAPADASTVCYVLRNGRLDCVEQPSPEPGAATTIAGRVDPRARPLLVLHIHDSADEDLRALVARDFDVRVLPASVEEVPRDAGAILIETSHATIAAAAEIIRSLARDPRTPPLVVVSRYALRSLDRARLLRAGADECLVHETGAAEFFVRLEAAIGRGHRRGAPPALAEAVEPMLQARPEPAGGGMLDREAFARGLAEHVTRDDPVQYSVVSLVPTTADAATLAAVAELASTTMRARSGDLATVHDAAVLVYLHGARRHDGAAFLDRVRARWAALGHQALRAEALTYPADEPRLRSLITIGEAP